MYWLAVLYLMIGAGIACGILSKSEKSLDVEIDGPFLVACLFWPYIIGIVIGQKIK